MPMSKFIDLLIKDHVNTCKLLALLKEQMDSFDFGGSTDFSLMQNIVDYMAEYTDTIHHAKEDLVYAALLEINSDYQDLIDDIQKEHKTLGALTKEFTLTLEEIVLESVMPRDTVSKLGHDFITQNSEHIEKEENTIFPIINETLTNQDWEKIEVSLVDKNDPLFGASVNEKYKVLYKLITGS